MLGIPPREQGELQGPANKPPELPDTQNNLQTLPNHLLFHASPYVSFSKKILFLSKSVEKFVRSAKKLQFLKFLGQYLIVPLLVCFQLNYSFFFISLIDTSCSSIVRFFLNDTIDVHENICAKKFCSQKRCPSLAKGMEMVLGLGGHSAFQEATEIISRGSWRLSPPPYLAGRGCI